MDIPDKIIQQAIAIFQPVIYLDSRSNYFPIDFNQYLTEAKLKRKSTGKVVSGFLSPSRLADMLEAHPSLNSLDYTFFLPLGRNSPVLDWKPHINTINSIPLYTHVYPCKGSPREFYINYIHMYAYNGALQVAGCLHLGSHYADGEHVTVHVQLDHADRPRMKRMFYSRHNGGKWLYPEDIHFEDTHPVVYSAYHSHASYDRPDDHFGHCRFWCFTRDRCDKGYRWFSNSLTRVYTNPDQNPRELAWVRFKGNLGNGHVTDFTSTGWWDTPDEEEDYGENCCFCIK